MNEIMHTMIIDLKCASNEIMHAIIDLKCASNELMHTIIECTH
jgi:hypothetical protein